MDIENFGKKSKLMNIYSHFMISRTLAAHHKFFYFVCLVTFRNEKRLLSNCHFIIDDI
jgi:hypothetical protein